MSGGCDGERKNDDHANDDHRNGDAIALQRHLRMRLKEDRGVRFSWGSPFQFVRELHRAILEDERVL